MGLDTGTSAEAADAATPAKLGTVRAAVLELLREHPSTDEELCARYAARGGPRYPTVTDQRLRTARAHLVRDGAVRDTGALAFTSLGNRCTLWEVT